MLITGCSSGIGRTTAKYFQEKDWNVIATLRKSPEADTELNALNKVLVAELDVTKEDTIKAAVAAGIEKFGKIDVLLNNAGYGSYGLKVSSGCSHLGGCLQVKQPLVLHRGIGVGLSKYF
ncbi:SDR family NAD(P)-dependent oxidoreductase [bacterium]|nr:SDR family NAD(P)-dependent oxidoreductase [bacterium]